MDNFFKNLDIAKKLQLELGLTDSLRDLYALELITEAEAKMLQTYKDTIAPKYTGDFETDSSLRANYFLEAGFKEEDLFDRALLNLVVKGYLDLDEAIVLQNYRQTENQ